MVDALPGRPLRALRDEEIADARGEPEPARIASPSIGRMTRRIEHGGGEDGRREILEGRRGFQFREAGIRASIKLLLDRRQAALHETVIAEGQRSRRTCTSDEEKGEQR